MIAWRTSLPPAIKNGPHGLQAEYDDQNAKATNELKGSELPIVSGYEVQLTAASPRDKAASKDHSFYSTM